MRNGTLDEAMLPGPPKEPTTPDSAMGDFVYCKSHVNFHRTGWCTVHVEDKIALKAKTENEAYNECRNLGVRLYQDVLEEQRAQKEAEAEEKVRQFGYEMALNDAASYRWEDRTEQDEEPSFLLYQGERKVGYLWMAKDKWVARDNDATRDEDYIKSGFATSKEAKKWVVGQIKARLKLQVKNLGKLR